jgi:ABC-type multidrug transport system ATPase subunit
MAANPAAMQLAFDIQGLTRTFGHHRALRGLDLQIEREECLAIFGPNGAGKTTLIKILATIMRPSGGRVLVEGIDLKGRPEDVRRHLGVVTHHTFLYANLTAYENLQFYSKLYDVPSPRDRIHEVIEQVGMTYRMNDRVGTFSRGMQQRISIARAVLHRPDIMLLDEPEAGLDQDAVELLWDIMRDDGGGKRTILLITHNLDRGLELCDRLVILDRGDVVYQNKGDALDLPGLREAYRSSTGVGA